MTSSQFNISYLPVEDRLLLQLNSPEHEKFLFLLTRRLTKQLVDGFEQIFVRAQEFGEDEVQGRPESTQQAMRDFEHDSAVQQSDFSTPFREQEETTPLGQNPILLNTIQLTLLDADNVLVKLILDEQQSLDITLDKQSLHGLYHILVKSVGAAEWDLQRSQLNSEGVETAGKKLN